MESQQIDVLKLTDFEYVDRWQNKVADGTFQYFGKDEPSVNYLVLNQHRGRRDRRPLRRDAEPQVPQGHCTGL